MGDTAKRTAVEAEIKRVTAANDGELLLWYEVEALIEAELTKCAVAAKRSTARYEQIKAAGKPVPKALGEMYRRDRGLHAMYFKALMLVEQTTARRQKELREHLSPELRDAVFAVSPSVAEVLAAREPEPADAPHVVAANPSPGG